MVITCWLNLDLLNQVVGMVGKITSIPPNGVKNGDLPLEKVKKHLKQYPSK